MAHGTLPELPGETFGGGIGMGENKKERMITTRNKKAHSKVL